MYVQLCGAWGGRPPRGLVEGRASARTPWATAAAAAAVGPGGEGKSQKNIQSPDRLYKAPKRLYKAPTDYTKPRFSGRKHPYASVCIRMHPYASIHLIYASERRYSRHVFAEKSKTNNKQNQLISLFYNVFRSAKSIRIQPIKPKLINMLQKTKNEIGLKS